MKVIKRLFFYLISIATAISLVWIGCFMIGKIPQAKTIFLNRNAYMILLPGAFLVVFCLFGMATICQKWKESSCKIGIAVIFCMILVGQVLYLYEVPICVGSEAVQFLNRLAAMTGRLYGNIQYRWIAGLLGIFCVDLALFFAAKIVWKIRGCRGCFLFLMLSFFSPLTYLWIAGYTAAICLLPFFMAGLYFLIKLGIDEGKRKKIGSLLLASVMIVLCLLILRFDMKLWNDVEMTLQNVFERAAVMWQDASCGFQQEKIILQDYTKWYSGLCGRGYDLLLAYIQMYTAALIILTIWGVLSSMVRYQSGAWTFLKVCLLLNFVVWIRWEIPATYQLTITLLFLMLAVEGLDWMTKQRDSWCKQSGEKTIKMLLRFGTASLFLITGTIGIVSMRKNEVSWNDYSVYQTVSMGNSLEKLTSDDVVIQTFHASIPFDHVKVEGDFESPDLAEGGCRLELLDEKGKVLAKRDMTAKEVKQEELFMKCDIISPYEETEYQLRITPLAVPEENALYLQRFDGEFDLYPDGKLKQNHEYQNGDLVFSVYKEN